MENPSLSLCLDQSPGNELKADRLPLQGDYVATPSQGLNPWAVLLGHFMAKNRRERWRL